MDEFALDASVTYEDLELLIEAEVNDPLPADLMQPEWLEEPVLDPAWLELPDLDPDWLQSIEQGEPELTPVLDQDLDLEH